MYQVYIKKGTVLRNLIGEFKDFDKAEEKIEQELAKDKDIKYVIEETTGHVDIYGNLSTEIIEEN